MQKASIPAVFIPLQFINTGYCWSRATLIKMIQVFPTFDWNQLAKIRRSTQLEGCLYIGLKVVCSKLTRIYSANSRNFRDICKVGDTNNICTENSATLCSNILARFGHISIKLYKIPNFKRYSFRKCRWILAYWSLSKLEKYHGWIYSSGDAAHVYTSFSQPLIRQKQQFKVGGRGGTDQART